MRCDECQSDPYAESQYCECCGNPVRRPSPVSSPASVERAPEPARCESCGGPAESEGLCASCSRAFHALLDSSSHAPDADHDADDCGGDLPDRPEVAAVSALFDERVASRLGQAAGDDWTLTPPTASIERLVENVAEDDTTERATGAGQLALDLESSVDSAAPAASEPVAPAVAESSQIQQPKPEQTPCSPCESAAPVASERAMPAERVAARSAAPSRVRLLAGAALLLVIVAAGARLAPVFRQDAATPAPATTRASATSPAASAPAAARPAPPRAQDDTAARPVAAAALHTKQPAPETRAHRTTPAPAPVAPPRREAAAVRPLSAAARPPASNATSKPVALKAAAPPSAAAAQPTAAPAATVEPAAAEPPAPEARFSADSAEAPIGPFFEVRDVAATPQVVLRVDPQVPPEFAGSVNDIVVVRVLVSQAGHPSLVRVLRGSRSGSALDEAVVSAVRHWQFSPARRRGEAVSCWYHVGVPITRAE